MCIFLLKFDKMENEKKNNSIEALFFNLSINGYKKSFTRRDDSKINSYLSQAHYHCCQPFLRPIQAGSFVKIFLSRLCLLEARLSFSRQKNFTKYFTSKCKFEEIINLF